jgi:hypothetical protein
VILHDRHFAFISRLDIPRCPAAVRRFVIAVVVNAIQCMSLRWSRSHVGNEVSHRLAPAFANRYPAPAIVLVCLVLGVVASLDHCNPGVVDRSARHPVLCIARYGDFEIETSATLTGAGSQGPAKHNPRCSAVAETFPEEVAFPVASRPLDDGQASKRLAAEVDSKSPERLFRFLAVDGRIACFRHLIPNSKQQHRT